jgi:hypothetical protein
VSVIEAVVFDLDGVLVDSEHIWDKVREALAHERGGRWDKGAHGAMMGMSSVEWSRYLHDVIGLAEPPDEINAEVVRRMEARYAENVPLVDGAVDAAPGSRARFDSRSPPRRIDHSSTQCCSRGACRPVRGNGVVRGGGTGQAGTGRLPGGGAPIGHQPRALRSDRGLRERDPRCAHGRDARDRHSEPSLSAAGRCSRFG